MKMLTRDDDKEYLASLKAKLEESGIPAVVHGEDTARMVFHKYLLEPTLWIYIDEQFEDAVKLMENPNHVVTTGIDMDEFCKITNSKTHQQQAFNEAVKQIAITIGIVMLGIFIFVKVLESI